MNTCASDHAYHRLRRRAVREGARPLLILISLSLLALSFAGPGFGQDAASQPLLNKWCPVTGDEQADPSITTTYEGRTIAFCCDRCRAKFKLNPERYVARLAALDAAESATARGAAPADEDAHAEAEPGEHDSADSAAAGGGHQHDGDAEAGEERPPLLGRVHPVIVHFPVAGIPLALLGFLAWLFSRRRILAGADVPPLLLAALAAIAAVITGNIAHDAMSFGPSLHDYVRWHQYAGTTVMILAVALSAVRLWRWNRLTGPWLWVYGGGLVVAAGLIGLTGYLGGSLVFGPDHLAW